MKQNPTHVNDPPRKLVTRDKTKPLSFQKVGPESGQLGVTWFKCLVVRYEMKKC
jgi:hypothetical protein